MEEQENYLMIEYIDAIINLGKAHKEFDRCIANHEPIGPAHDEIIKSEKEFYRIHDEFCIWSESVRKLHGG